MLEINVTAETDASPDRVLTLAGTDFSDHRAEIWPNVTTRRLEVHERGDTYAVVTEGATGIARFAWDAAATTGPNQARSHRLCSTPTCSPRARAGSCGSRHAMTAEARCR